MMKNRFLPFHLAFLACTALTMGCGGGNDRGTSGDASQAGDAATTSGGADGRDTDDGSSGADMTPSSRTTAAIDGFDLDLREGAFWEFQYTTHWRGALDEQLTAHFELGAPTPVAGKTAYPLSLSYSNGNGGNSFQLAQENGVWFKYADGNWKVLFDAWNGKWPAAGGFFGKVADSGVAAAAEGEDDEGRALYSVTWQANSKDCTMIPGYEPVCGDVDPSELAQATEQWLATLGPFHSRFLGCTSDGCLEQEYVLKASSFGAATGFPTEPTVEPSDPGPPGGGAD